MNGRHCFIYAVALTSSRRRFWSDECKWNIYDINFRYFISSEKLFTESPYCDVLIFRERDEVLPLGRELGQLHELWPLSTHHWSLTRARVWPNCRAAHLCLLPGLCRLTSVAVSRHYRLYPVQVGILSDMRKWGTL